MPLGLKGSRLEERYREKLLINCFTIRAIRATLRAHIATQSRDTKLRVIKIFPV